MQEKQLQSSENMFNYNIEFLIFKNEINLKVDIFNSRAFNMIQHINHWKLIKSNIRENILIYACMFMAGDISTFMAIMIYALNTTNKHNTKDI